MGADAARRIERVVFDEYDIRTWYPSPYPLEEELANATLYVCAGCFKYMATPATLHTHRRACPHRHPPGRKVYQRGAHIIWEVDGALQKLYMQNLCLFGKLFIDHKTVYFDVEPFVCYLLTDATSQFDHVLGFFSKEKVSYDDYNLACIVVFPPFQRKGYGTLLMEYSYWLSRQAAVAGTPERPLSALGLRGYVAFWAAQVLRTLQCAYTADAPGARRLRTVLAGEAVPAPAPADTPKRRKTARGWEGELVKAAPPAPPAPNGPTVPLPPETTLARLAAAAGLRVDDTTLALAHAGLLMERDGRVCLSRAAIDAAAARLRVKPAILDEAYLL
ncbi:histone acetyltransferase [Malassezia obtusa]|uniref:histone acetyltransferase n=1 Tax=Malassezia obtusa TaxID=76774 RepID=A0AAF0IX26_9BASI|nr:histone acetyltransferase [Malassezia obtusa]